MRTEHLRGASLASESLSAHERNSLANAQGAATNGFDKARKPMFSKLNTPEIRGLAAEVSSFIPSFLTMCSNLVAAWQNQLLLCSASFLSLLPMYYNISDASRYDADSGLFSLVILHGVLFASLLFSFQTRIQFASCICSCTRINHLITLLGSYVGNLLA